ncbi:hypothetical protein [uncultured Sphingomonas sp.]|uniref:hypothetical protein n=1 Tax=uncultured Sphingomonas sp. TaxID=158754 RepID=UPI0025D1BFB7|nr:hypothetical protein [uncultured Sphingomonas sp.]
MNLTLTLALAITTLCAVTILAVTALAGWRGWLSLQQQRLGDRAMTQQPTPNAGTRIEIADLKERIRKLEAIAAGVEL